MPSESKTSQPRKRIKRIQPEEGQRPTVRTRAAKENPEAPARTEAKVSSPDQIVGEIMRGLYNGRYVPGQKLTEADLTRRFGVGRGTIREAFRRLAAEGIITINLHRGANIRALTRQDVRDILEVTESLTTLSARLAAERASRLEDQKALRETLANLKKFAAAGEPFEVARMRNRFYRQLAHLSGNGELARLVATVQTHLIRVQFRAVYGVPAERQRLIDYQRVVEAVLARDPAKAERAMRQHIRRAALIIDSLPDEAFG